MATKLAISAFVSFITKMCEEGAGYIMGSYGQNPRTGYLDLNITTCKSAWKPDGYYYSQYKDSPSQYEKAIYWRNHSKRVFDCQGLSEGYYEIMTGVSVNTYARNNYASWCNPKGSGMIPVKWRVPGAAVFWGDSASAIHHIGYLEKPVKEGHPEGDWYIIEARGVKYGVVRTQLYERKPNYWGWMTKYYDYDGSSIVPAPVPADNPTLRNGSKGDAVRKLQENLIELGYDLGRWGADGDFGDATEIAVKKFQKDHQLTVDGVVGPKTWAALDEAINKVMTPVKEPKTVEIVNGNCYVRPTPNTSQAPLGVVKAGTKLEYRGETDENTGWYAVKFEGKDGWVSGKYAKLIDEPFIVRGEKIVDLSKYEPTIDYDALIKDTAVIILRAGYRKSNGKIYKDEKFDLHAGELKKRGVRFGVYFFSIATNETKAAEEAKAFYEYAKPYDPLFWAMDAENENITTAAIKKFRVELKKAGAKKVGCYVPHYVYNKYKFDTIRDEFEFVWGAKVGNTKPFFKCDLWQYTTKGTVNGIDKNVDLNKITGDGHKLEWFCE